ncbi:hypothetical protein GCM10029992_17900 [Glycomyces albus]
MEDNPASHPAPVVPRRGSRRGLGLDELRLTGGFWERLQRTNADATLRHCLEWMERLGWIANFDRVREGATEGERPGWPFSDSEVYKLVEALAWRHGTTGDAWANKTLEALTERIGAAQDDDGYLNTCFGHDGQRSRYSDLSAGHELYCTGHLLQAAVARVRTSGEDELVAIARRAADHVCREFGPEGREGICGHAEIEVGLAEFGRALGEERYTEQARLFIERRGHGTLAPIALLDASYFQDDEPVRRAAAWRGTPCAPCTWPPGPSTSPSTPQTTNCSRPSNASGTTPWSAAPTSPAAWARATRTRASARTGSCRPTAPTARPAPASPRSWSPGGSTWPPAKSATRT